MTFGIYSIEFLNDTSRSIYIGSTRASFRRRWRDHLNALRKGEHKNHYMQELYDEYGNPHFQVIEECFDKERVRYREKFFMLEFQKDRKLINLEEDPVNHLMSKETRKKLGRSMKAAKYKRGKQYTKIPPR